jgi:hypothetical protein
MELRMLSPVPRLVGKGAGLVVPCGLLADGGIRVLPHVSTTPLRTPSSSCNPANTLIDHPHLTGIYKMNNMFLDFSFRGTVSPSRNGPHTTEQDGVCVVDAESDCPS